MTYKTPNDFFIHVAHLDIESARATIASADPERIKTEWEPLMKMPQNHATCGFVPNFHAKHLEMLQLLYGHTKAHRMYAWVDPTATPQNYPMLTQLIASSVANHMECTVICRNKNKGDMFKRLWPNVKKWGWAFEREAPQDSLVFIDPYFLDSPAYDGFLKEAINWAVRQNATIYLLGETWNEALLIQDTEHPILPPLCKKNETVINIIKRSAPECLAKIQDCLNRSQRQRLTTVLTHSTQKASSGVRKM